MVNGVYWKCNEDLEKKIIVSQEKMLYVTEKFKCKKFSVKSQ